jgi:hypothetical protein
VVLPKGLEPSPEDWCLKPARLPIPPREHNHVINQSKSIRCVLLGIYNLTDTNREKDNLSLKFSLSYSSPK